tara:strand:+ start:189 stop:611 length:423 start_codon:yes stop_codon:yes gene_type:complete
MAHIEYAKLSMERKPIERTICEILTAEVRINFSPLVIEKQKLFNLQLFLVNAFEGFPETFAYTGEKLQKFGEAGLLAYKTIFLKAFKNGITVKKDLCYKSGIPQNVNGVRLYAEIFPASGGISKWSNKYFFEIELGGSKE